MKTIHLTLLFITMTFTAFAQEPTVIDAENEYGGVTYERHHSPAQDPNFSLERLFYNQEKQLRRVDVVVRSEISAENGIETQSIFFNQERRIGNYVMFYSDEYYEIHGVNRLIEYVNERDEVTRSEWYADDLYVDFLEDMDIITRFPYYNLSYLASRMLDDVLPPDGRDVWSFSAKYRGIRSVVRFVSDLLPLTDLDREIISKMGLSMGNDDVAKYYSSKILVSQGGYEFWAYVQPVMEPDLPKKTPTTIRYYVLGYNNELYLVCVALTNIDN